jgi:hypothetical protein
MSAVQEMQNGIRQWATNRGSSLTRKGGDAIRMPPPGNDTASGVLTVPVWGVRGGLSRVERRNEPRRARSHASVAPSQQLQRRDIAPRPEACIGSTLEVVP